VWSDHFLKQILPPFDIYRIDDDGTNRCACVGTLDSAKVTVEKSCDSAIYNESFAQCPASNNYQLSLIHRAFDSRFDNSVIPLQSPRFFSAEIKNRNR